MRQDLHLLIVDRETGTSLAARHGSRWLLPVLACAERLRAGPLAKAWAARRGFECDVVGQWLGNITSVATDWLMVLRVTSRKPHRLHPQLEWTPLQTLASDTALLAYQGWALRRSLARGSLPTVPGPFGRFGWLDDVRVWIDGVSSAVQCSTVMQFRSSPSEVVLRAHTGCGDLYFKGLTGARASEAKLTQALAAFEPRWFAPTLAVEERPDGSTWWLTAAAPGRPAIGRRYVAAAIARAQSALATLAPIRELRPLDLRGAVRWAAELVADGCCVSAYADHIECVVNARVPLTWLPMDLHPTNVLVDRNGGVRFIDLDDSFFGAAPLAMAMFARRCGDASLHRVYEDAWSPPLADMRWPAFEGAAALIETWLGWRRFERNRRRGEVHGALDVVATRIRERLMGWIHRG